MDLLETKVVQEGRGHIQVWDDLPFAVVRVFTIRNVPQGAVRGNHAHKTCHQVLICETGCMRFRITKCDGREENFTLLPGQAFHLRPRHWIQIHDWSPTAVLLVLCSEKYFESEMIRDFSNFLNIGE